MQKIFTAQNAKHLKDRIGIKSLHYLPHSQFNHAFQVQKKKSNSFYDIVFAEKNHIDKKKLNLDNLEDSEYSNIEYFDKQKQRRNLENISYISDYQDPIKDYTVGKAVPKCGVDDFYPNGNPSLPDPKKIQNAINEHIKEEVEKQNEEMQNKFVCMMTDNTDKHYDHFYEMLRSPAVSGNLLFFGVKPPTKEQSDALFKAECGNGNLIYAVCDAKNKEVIGCIGARFHNVEMPLKDGTYSNMIVPEIWAKMSKPMHGMSSLLRKIQTELYKDFSVTFSRIPCNNLLTWQPHSEKIFEMIPSFKLPMKGGGMDMQTYYGVNGKKMTPEQRAFLNTMCTQIVNAGLTNQQQSSEKDATNSNNVFGR